MKKNTIKILIIYFFSSNFLVCMKKEPARFSKFENCNKAKIYQMAKNFEIPNFLKKNLPQTFELQANLKKQDNFNANFNKDYYSKDLNLDNNKIKTATAKLAIEAVNLNEFIIGMEELVIMLNKLKKYIIFLKYLEKIKKNSELVVHQNAEILFYLKSISKNIANLSDKKQK